MGGFVLYLGNIMLYRIRVVVGFALYLGSYVV